MKTLIRILKVAYWASFVCSFILSILNVHTLIGTAFGAIAALQCMLALVYDRLNDKINKNNNN